MSRILMIVAADRAAPLSGEAEVVLRAAPGIPAAPISAHDWTLADLAVLAAGQNAEAEGFSAVCVGEFGDFGANALRSVLDIPVVAAGRSAMLYALTLGARFGIVAPPAGYTRAKKLVQEYGLSLQCTGVRAYAETATEGAILTAAKLAIEEDGAEVLVLGEPVSPEMAARLAAALPVPVVEPASLAVMLAESFLGLGLGQSRRTYPVPQARKPDLIAKLIAAGEAA